MHYKLKPIWEYGPTEDAEIRLFKAFDILLSDDNVESKVKTRSGNAGNNNFGSSDSPH